MADCYLNGKHLTFNSQEFVGAGGQADVYGRAGVAYKLYHNPAEMIPVEKIKELMVLNLPNILGPKDVLYNGKGKPAGFAMPLVSGTVALRRVFTNGFRRTKNVTAEMSVKLVEALIAVTQFIHERHCLVADGNENNYLVDGVSLVNPYFIDVDNYSTPSFAAEYLNPSVRDYQANGFSILTDWYALAIVACQIFVGLHPFKGNHPQFDPDDLEGRMRKNVSIFNKDVSVPPPTRDYSNIPAEYYEWFVNLFEKGKRTPPPKAAGLLNVSQVAVKVLQSTLKFVTSLIQAYKAPIVRMEQHDDRVVVITRKRELWVDRIAWDIPNTDCDVVLFDGGPIIASIEKGMLRITSLTKREMFVPLIAAEQSFVVENTLYVKQGNKLIEIGLTRLGNKIVVTASSAWGIMPLASTLYDGVVLQNMLGKMWAAIPKPGKCYMMALPELDKVKIVSSRCVQHVCMVSGYKKNRLICFKFFFSGDFSKYTCVEEPADDPDVNFTVLPNGVTVQWDGRRMYIIYPNLQTDIVEDTKLPPGMLLRHMRNKLMFFVGDKVYHITSKKQ